MAIPPLVLDPPVPLPIPDGLFAVAQPKDIPEHGAYAGAIWVPDTMITAEVTSAPCQAGPYSAFTADVVDGLAQAFPFAVYATIFSGAAGFDAAEMSRRVRQRLINYEQNIVERAFWGPSTQTIFQNLTPVFAGTTSPTAAVSPGVAGGVLQQVAAAGANAGFHDLSGAAVSITEGISQLEQSAADNYCQNPILHVRPRLGAYLGKNRLIKARPTYPSGELSYNESPYVLGNGYAGTGPTTQAPGATVEYAWATGRIQIWRTPDIWVSPPDLLVNRATDQRGLYAVRRYMMGIESFAACVQINPTL